MNFGLTIKLWRIEFSFRTNLFNKHRFERETTISSNCSCYVSYESPKKEEEDEHKLKS